MADRPNSEETSLKPSPEEPSKEQATAPWEGHRETLRARFSPETIATLPEVQLLAIHIAPSAPGSALARPVIVLPSEWMPPGTARSPSYRSIDLRRALPDGMDPEGSVAKAILMSLRRMMLALWIVPYVGRRDAFSLPKISTWIIWSKHLIKKAHWALSRHPSEDGRIFAHLDLNGLTEMVKANPDPTSVFGHLTQFRHRGILHDWPDITALEQRQNEASKGGEKNRKGQAMPTNEIKQARKWQYLPDSFVTELGWRSKWLIEQLGASILDCYEACLAVSGGSVDTIRIYREKIIAGWVWSTPGGKEIKSLPFSLCLHGHQIEAWPPPNWEKLQQAIFVLQGVNLFVASLAMAGRVSEVLSLRDGGEHADRVSATHSPDKVEIEIKVENVSQARVIGRTYKLVEKIGGAERDWPIPPIVAEALILQKRLARIHRPMGSNHLWICLSSARGEGIGSPMNAPTTVFNSLVAKFGLQKVLGEGERFHHHRCRKTVARLVGLALVGAPKMLMDLFGHKTIEMALSYILSDPDFAAEVEEVAKAQVIIMGKKAIESAEANGGPAALGIRKAVFHEKARRSDKAYHAESDYELAEMLTLDGRSCQLVRAGVICTKGPGEVGPCARGTSTIDPSRCKYDCVHRLELAAIREDTDGAIAVCVEKLQEAMANEDEIMIEWWRGQLQHHLGRFDDLRDKWKIHPTVADLMTGETENTA